MVGQQGSVNASSGGGYFGSGFGRVATAKGSSRIGGMSGSPHWGSEWFKDVAGNGGSSGCGGIITYQNADNIFAFNGDMITNGDYDTPYYEYDKDGNKTGTVLHVYERNDLNGKKVKFIPTKIFAQSGGIRKTYTTNQSKFTLDKVTRELNLGEKLPSIAQNYDDVLVIVATNETDTPTTGYTNPETLELENQGIGSGARIFGSLKWNICADRKSLIY